MFIAIFILASVMQTAGGEKAIEKDVIATAGGNLTISFIGHGSLMFEVNGKVIHIDPWGRLADYSKLPKADIVLLTHHHQDHLDTDALAKISSGETRLIETKDVHDILKKGRVMKNGDTLTLDGINIESVPAYNTTKGHEQYHPKGRDNGYVLTIGGKRIYIAGDTEDIPEMASLKNIDIAFLPMNQPYTMTPEQVADAVGKFHPKILYPYHTGDTDVSRLKKLLSKDKALDLRIRPMQ